MNEFLTFLTTIRPISPALEERIKKTFQPRFYAKGNYVIREGDGIDWVIFVQSGILRCYSLEGPHGTSKYFLLPYDFQIIGTIHQPNVTSTEFLQALGDSNILICSKTNLDSIYNDFPEFEYHARIVAQRCATRLYKVLDSIRMHDARERYQFLKREFPEIARTVPNKYLASYLGITHITLSRIRSRL